LWRQLQASFKPTTTGAVLQATHKPANHPLQATTPFRHRSQTATYLLGVEEVEEEVHLGLRL